MAVRRLSEIALAGAPPASTDTVVGVGAGTIDLRYTVAQIGTAIGPSPGSYLTEDGVSRKFSAVAANSSPIAPTDTLMGVQGTTDVQYKTTDIGFIKATSSITFYISPTGNDATAVPGNISFPYATAQAAINQAARYDWQDSWSPTIQFLDGTYSLAASQMLIDTTINSSNAGWAIQGHVSDATKVVLTEGQFTLFAIGTAVNVSWLTFNSSHASAGICFNLLNGVCTINGDIIFASDALPFVLRGLAWIEVSFCNLTIQATSLQSFLTCAPGVAIFSNVNTIFPVGGLTIANPFGTPGFILAEGYVGNGVIGITFIKIGAPTYSGGAVTGNRVVMSQLAILVTENGEISDVPGTTTGVIDATCVVENFSGKQGRTFLQVSSPITTASVPQYCETNIKDLSTGNCYTVFNDLGNMRIKQIGRQPNTQTASYVLAFSDADGRIEMNSAGATTVTFPLNASVPYSIGTEIRISNIGAGATTPTAAGGVTGHNFSALAQWATAVFYKRGTDEWVQTGV